MLLPISCGRLRFLIHNACLWLFKLFTLPNIWKKLSISVRNSYANLFVNCERISSIRVLPLMQFSIENRIFFIIRDSMVKENPLEVTSNAHILKNRSVNDNFFIDLFLFRFIPDRCGPFGYTLRFECTTHRLLQRFTVFGNFFLRISYLAKLLKIFFKVFKSI